MTSAVLLERISALQTTFDDAHRRVVEALQSNDLPTPGEADRLRVAELARQLRTERDGGDRTKAAG